MELLSVSLLDVTHRPLGSLNESGARKGAQMSGGSASSSVVLKPDLGEFAHNSLTLVSTGFTPFECVYGYQPPLFQALEQEVGVPSAVTDSALQTDFDQGMADPPLDLSPL